MALKGDRQELEHDISFFLNETAERGRCAFLSTPGSGASLDQAANLLQIAAVANSSGQYVMGVLMNDVVDIDQTRQHLNQHKNETIKGGKVTLLKRGDIVTNMTSGSMSSVAGKPAYAGPYGLFTDQNPGGRPKVGQFRTNADADGFVKIAINIPQA